MPPDAAPGLAGMEQQAGLDGSEYPNTVAARIVTRIGFYSPGRRAGAVKCPALIQIARADAVREYDLGHFDWYVDPAFPTVVADQLTCLKSAVPI